GIQQFNVHEAEKLKVIQAPLSGLYGAATIQIARSVRQLALDDPTADALVADDLDDAKMRDRSRRRREDNRRVFPAPSVVLVNSDLRVGIALIPKLVERHFTRR